MKKNDKISLEKEDFSFVCPLKVEDMKSVDGGHFCEGCEKKVYDVSNFSRDEYKSLLGSQKDVCISFTKVATLSLALTFSACSSVNSRPLVGKVTPTMDMKNVKSCDTNSTKSKVVDDAIPVTTAGLPAPIKED